jgi:hypothetical protein
VVPYGSNSNTGHDHPQFQQKAREKRVQAIGKNSLPYEYVTAIGDLPNRWKNA